MAYMSLHLILRQRYSVQVFACAPNQTCSQVLKVRVTQTPTPQIPSPITSKSTGLKSKYRTSPTTLHLCAWYAHSMLTRK